MISGFLFLFFFKRFLSGIFSDLSFRTVDLCVLSCCEMLTSDHSIPAQNQARGWGTYPLQSRRDPSPIPCADPLQTCPPSPSKELRDFSTRHLPPSPLSNSRRDNEIKSLCLLPNGFLTSKTHKLTNPSKSKSTLPPTVYPPHPLTPSPIPWSCRHYPVGFELLFVTLSSCLVRRLSRPPQTASRAATAGQGPPIRADGGKHSNTVVARWLNTELCFAGYAA